MLYALYLYKLVRICTFREQANLEPAAKCSIRPNGPSAVTFIRIVLFELKRAATLENLPLDLIPINFVAFLVTVLQIFSAMIPSNIHTRMARRTNIGRAHGIPDQTY